MKNFSDTTSGCTPDIGIYAINFLIMVMGNEMPLEIKTMSKLNDSVSTEIFLT